MSSYVCNACGGTTFSYVNKDAAHIGVYCDCCGKWFKWAGKKEYTNKSILPYSVFYNQVMKNKQMNGNNVSTSQVDVTNKLTEPQHINNGYVQSNVVKTPEPAAPIGASVVAEMANGEHSQASGNLQLKIAPRGEVTITANTGEQVKLTNILIKVSSKGVVLLDVTGDIIRTFNFE